MNTFSRESPGFRMIDAIHDNRAIARTSARRLESIASAMSRLGMMPEIVEELDRIGEAVMASAERVIAAHGDHQSEQIAHGNAMTSSLMEMALVVLPRLEAAGKA